MSERRGTGEGRRKFDGGDYVTIREVGALMSTLNQKLDDHLEDHEDALIARDAEQRRRTTRLQILISIGLLLSPILSAVTTHVIH